MVSRAAVALLQRIALQQEKNCPTALLAQHGGRQNLT
jgi:hypothetical protein